MNVCLATGTSATSKHDCQTHLGPDTGQEIDLSLLLAQFLTGRQVVHPPRDTCHRVEKKLMLLAIMLSYNHDVQSQQFEVMV